MKHKKNKSGIPVIILLLGVALIVVGSIFATSYLYTKEKYAGSNKAYSYSLIPVFRVSHHNFSEVVF